jgi:hypothetical protein
MMFLAHLLIVSAFIGYLGGVVGGAILLVRGGVNSWWRVVMRGSAFLSAAAIIGVGMAILAAPQGQFEGAAPYYIMVLALVEGGCFAAGLRSPRDRVWLSSGGLAILGAMSVLSHVTREPVAPFGGGAIPSALILIHLGSAIVAEGCLAVLGIVAAASVAADRRLRLMKLPAAVDEELSLVRLDTLYRLLVMTGFASMTVSAASGGVGALFTRARPPSDVTLSFAIASWILLGMLVHLRWGRGWPLVRVSHVVSIIVPGLFLGYLGMAVIRGELFHKQLHSIPHRVDSEAHAPEIEESIGEPGNSAVKEN